LKLLSALALAALAVSVAGPASAEEPGITATEIKIGQTMPYSGPISSYGSIGRAEAAYFAMINEQGGVNGRKIALLSRDDGYSPPKTVEQIRRLVENDGVAFFFQTLGDVTNAAVERYLNDRHIPQLFVADGSARWDDPKHFPWTMGWQPSYRTEGLVDAHYILQTKPDAHIGVLVQNSLGGKDGVTAFEEGLGAKKGMIVKELTYESTDATIDTQIDLLQSAGADVLIDYAVPKFAAQVIRRLHALDWHPLHILSSVSASVSLTLEPAGLDNSVGIVSVGFLKDPNTPDWRDDPAVKDWRAWMDKYFPEGDKRDVANIYAYLAAQTMVQVLRQCGNDLSRENVMRQAANLHDLALPLLLPGIRINTSPTDYRPVKQLQPMRFNGRNWELFGTMISG